MAIFEISDLRTEWRTAKDDAVRLNNGNSIDIRIGGRQLDLGPTLDEWQKALDRLEAMLPGAEKQQARLTFFSIGDRVRGILGAYQSYLEHNPVAMRDINSAARGTVLGCCTRISVAVRAEENRLGGAQAPPLDPGGEHPPIGPDKPLDPHDVPDPIEDPEHNGDHGESGAGGGGRRRNA